MVSTTLQAGEGSNVSSVECLLVLGLTMFSFVRLQLSGISACYLILIRPGVVHDKSSKAWHRFVSVPGLECLTTIDRQHPISTIRLVQSTELHVRLYEAWGRYRRHNLVAPYPQLCCACHSAQKEPTPVTYMNCQASYTNMSHHSLVKRPISCNRCPRLFTNKKAYRDDP